MLAVAIKPAIKINSKHDVGKNRVFSKSGENLFHDAGSLAAAGAMISNREFSRGSIKPGDDDPISLLKAFAYKDMLPLNPFNCYVCCH
jgi:hypothetical protein